MADTARTYTGDLPEDFESVDVLVAGLVASVERVRRKYAHVVARLSMATGIPVVDLLNEANEAVDRG